MKAKDFEDQLNLPVRETQSAACDLKHSRARAAASSFDNFPNFPEEAQFSLQHEGRPHPSNN